MALATRGFLAEKKEQIPLEHNTITEIIMSRIDALSC
jgi:hypothetical protein